MHRARGMLGTWVAGERECLPRVCSDVAPRRVKTPRPRQGSVAGSVSEASFSLSSCSISDELPSVAQLREARKRTDLNAQALANRIAYLREEGEKVCKRLELTKYRTQELATRPSKADEQKALLQQRLEEIRAQQRRNLARCGGLRWAVSTRIVPEGDDCEVGFDHMLVGLDQARLVPRTYMHAVTGHALLSRVYHKRSVVRGTDLQHGACKCISSLRAIHPSP